MIIFFEKGILVKINLLCAVTLALVFTTICPNTAYANNNQLNNNQLNNNRVVPYLLSDSFSNILPIKQLIKDDWLQTPATDSSIGFTQNEVGLKAYWGNLSFNVAHRVDYFILTNPDTAQAFYLERANKPLTTQDSYQLSLKLHHQRSNGFRLGYQWQFQQFTTAINLGYWQVTASRESSITGEVFGDEQNNITGIADVQEFYSDKNFLKRGNNGSWDLDGYGVTVDLAMTWKASENIDVNLEIKDLYSQFNMKNLGYSQGRVNTEGSFINSLGGKSYLPLYRGKETTRNYEFDLPEQVNLIAQYQSDDIAYLARFKRQGEVNFYYAGAGFDFEESNLKLLLDLEHLSPELEYTHSWFAVRFAIDDIDIDKAMLFSLGLSAQFAF
jgi:hypothetical protein